MEFLDTEWRQKLDQLFLKAAFIQNLGLKPGEAGAGFCETHLEVQHYHKQQNHLIHAGVLATIADHSAGGAATTLLKPSQYVLTVEFKINLLRPAQGRAASLPFSSPQGRRSAQLRRVRGFLFESRGRVTRRQGQCYPGYYGRFKEGELMKKLTTSILTAAFLLGASIAMAKPLTKTITTTTTSTTEGGVPTTVIHQDDGPAVGDPVGGSGVGSRTDQGPANTQKYCAEGSTDPDCVRAEKRQTAPTTWQEDCATGATKACPK